MKVTTRATIVKIEGHRSGAYQVTRLVTTGPDGEPVSTTWFGMVYRGLDVEGGDRSLEDVGPVLEPSDVGEPSEHFTIPISAGAALVYTECARIWNPIHTDAAVAAAAGLPGPILQGTATLARAVSRVVDERFDGDAERVTRIAGRFGAMVLMPSTLTLRVGAVVDHSVRFEVGDSGGDRAIRDGLLTVRTS
jgi:acyl dehydratase